MSMDRYGTGVMDAASGTAIIRTGQVGIVTPDAVLLELEVADYGSRLAAKLLDLLIQALALTAVALAMGLANRLLGGLGDTLNVVILIGAAFGAVVVYPAVAETLGRGQTIGKRAVGLRVITIEGGPIRFRHAATRAALALVDVYPGGLLASVSMLADRRCRRPGDLAAGTIVVRERGATEAPTPLWFQAPAGWEAYVADLPAVNLTSAQYEVIRSFLLRAPDLTVAARANLSRRLAAAVGTRLGRPLGPGTPPELWLLAVAAAWQEQMPR
jgi:uncharacterized RDD family membrane protein YckC